MSKKAEKPSAKKGAQSSSKPEKQPKQQQPKPSEQPELERESSGADEILVDVESPQVKKGAGILGILGAEETSGVDPPKAEKKSGKKSKRGRPKKVQLKPEELADLLLVPGLLLVCSKLLPEALLPNDDEALGFCAPLARIIVRHMPKIPASADAMDLGKMFIAGMGYWLRIRPILEQMQEQKEQPERRVRSRQEEMQDDSIVDRDNGNAGIRSGLAGSGLAAGSGATLPADS